MPLPSRALRAEIQWAGSPGKSDELINEGANRH